VNVYVKELGEHLSRSGWTVDMFTRQWAPQDEIVIHNPNCRTIRLKAGPTMLPPDRSQLILYIDEFLESFLQFQSQNKLNCAIIQTNYWLSGQVGLKLKRMNFSAPLVHVSHSLGRMKQAWMLENGVKNSPSINSAQLDAERDIFENADLVVALSENELKDIQAYSLNLCQRNRNVVVIPCGVNSQQFDGKVHTKAQARQAIGMDLDSKMVLYVGRFDRRKGIDVLVEAINQSIFRDDPKLSLVIAGGMKPGLSDELEYRRIQEVVHARNLQNITQFPGILSRGDSSLQLRYAAADVLVVPSRYEPFGTVSIEGMSMEVPVVASAVGGLQSTLIDGATGFLVESGDHQGFAMRIDQILTSPALGEALGQMGKKRVNQYFTWEKVSQQIEHRLKQLLTKKQTEDSFPCESRPQFYLLAKC